MSTYIQGLYQRNERNGGTKDTSQNVDVLSLLLYIPSAENLKSKT